MAEKTITSVNLSEMTPEELINNFPYTQENLEYLYKFFEDVENYSDEAYFDKCYEVAKKQLIAERTISIINESAEAMRKNVTKAMESGAFDINNYDVDNWLPRIIFQALLKEESNQHQLRDSKDKRVSNNIYALL